MPSPSPTLVHRIVAQESHTPLERLRDDQRLGPDLGFDLSALVLVALRCEEHHRRRGAFPVELLDPDMRVGELAALYDLWSRREDHASEAERSGQHRSAGPQQRGEPPGDWQDDADTLRDAPPDDAPHVLIAEDDAELRALLVAVLRADGYRVSEVANGLELLRATTREALEEARYDAIVSDVLMPGVSGLAALMELNYVPSAPPMVLITASGDPDIHLWAQQLGAAAMFDKPFDIDDLETVLRNLRGWHRWRPSPNAAADTSPHAAPW